MSRKATAATDGRSPAADEPRRSLRIKEQPKVEVPVSKAAKPHAKDKFKEGDKNKPKRGRKRKEPAAAENGDSDEAAPAAEDEASPAKKVRNAACALLPCPFTPATVSDAMQCQR
jgi:hypothetical protein